MVTKKAIIGALSLLVFAALGCEPPAEHFDATSTKQRQAEKDWREGHNGPKPGTVK
jgi:hypothetical protein